MISLENALINAVMLFCSIKLSPLIINTISLSTVQDLKFYIFCGIIEAKKSKNLQNSHIYNDGFIIQLSIFKIVSPIIFYFYHKTEWRREKEKCRERLISRHCVEPYN